MPICPVCHKEFEQSKRRGRKRIYCSEECHNKVKVKTKEQYKPCIQCGKLTNTKFCSIECNRAWWKSHPEERKDYKHICEYCGISFYSKNKHQKFCSLKCASTYNNKHKHMITKNCEYCGKIYEVSVNNAYSRCCSLKCTYALYSKNNRDKCNQKAHRYLTRKMKQFIEDVSLEYLYHRDKGVCGICGERVNLKYKYPHPLSPSIDHIIPISKGGFHSKNNCQLAHFVCNSTKNNKLINDKQLILIG